LGVTKFKIQNSKFSGVQHKNAEKNKQVINLRVLGVGEDCGGCRGYVSKSLWRQLWGGVNNVNVPTTASNPFRCRMQERIPGITKE